MKLLLAFNDSDKVIDIDVSTDMTLADLKAYLEAEGGGVKDDLRIFYRSEPMNGDNMPLSHWSLQDNDMLMVAQQVEHASSSVNGDLARVNNDIERTRQELLRNVELQNNIKTQHPKLIEAINDSSAFKAAMLSIESERVTKERARQAELRNLQNNPDSEEAQRKILELIQERAVEENFDTAMEHSPEVFGKVEMLFVNVSVNNVPFKAFVDSGAQTTFVSQECVEKCNLTHLIDRRFHGIAMGVGKGKILGRIHSAPMKIGDSFLPCSLTVMEKSVTDLLIGLDMLKRYQAVIDLKKNALVIGNSEVSFLPENEIPQVHSEIMSKAISDVETSAPSSGLTVDLSSTDHTSGPVPPSQVHAESSIRTLMNLGFSRQECVNALNQTGGNAELAASFLFQ